MSGGTFPPDADEVAARARALWREARDLHRGPLDVYLKTSARVRVSRRPGDGAEVVSHALECGIAVRVVPTGAPVASFAACAGASEDDVRWAMAMAASAVPVHDAAMPERGTIAQSERRDLDPPEPLPASEELSSWLALHPSAGWIECGSTIEALAGDEGWLTLRRRSRVWALIDDGRPRLVARRGYRLADDSGVPARDAVPLGEAMPRPDLWWFDPSAAASLVAALARGLHGDPSRVGSPVGPEWRLRDDPTDASALFGGSFDDAGFPAARRVVTDGGRMTSALDGPGTLRRPSYRDAPAPGHSHLLFLGRRAPPPAEGGRRVSRCRVVPLARDAWLLVMDSEGEGSDPTFLTMPPDEIPRKCTGTWGPTVLSAEGVLTAGLAMELDLA